MKIKIVRKSRVTVERTYFDWCCISCRTVWRQDSTLQLPFVCTICCPPLHVSEWLHPL